MWGRFGSPTGRAGSGTEEEFDTVLTRWKESPENVQIMFYFKDAGIAPSETDTEQMAKVQAFKEKIRAEGGLYQMFNTTEEFRNKIRIHLVEAVLQWKSTHPEGALPPDSVIATKSKASEDNINPLSNLTALAEDDYIEGVIELSDSFHDAMENVSRGHFKTLIFP